MIRDWLTKLGLFIKKNAADAEPNFMPFGLVSGLGFLAYYFVWHDVSQQPYESMPLRLGAVLLCFTLAAKDYWPKRIRGLLPYFWYLTLVYTLPFFFSFMLLKNGTSTLWPMNTMIALVLLVLLTDWLSMAAILVVGLSIAAGAYVLTTPLPQLPANLTGLLATYIPIILAGGLFVYRKDKVHTEKLNSIAAVSATLAHELNTPLATLKMAVNQLEQVLPNLVASHKRAVKQGLVVQPYSENYLRLVQELPTILGRETDAASTFMRMLSINAEREAPQEQKEEFSMISCIEQALVRYPFTEPQKELIRFQSANDFRVKGNQLLLIHVVFNLLKNALFYIAAANKPDSYIQIWLETDNRVFFKDTGTGIAKEHLPYIFEPFFSKTLHGTGIGLSYCKMVMESLGGRIACKSVEGDYTLFILSFASDLGQHHEIC